MDRRPGALLAAGLVLTAALTGCGLTGGDEDSEFCRLLGQQLPAYPADPLKALPADAGAAAWKAHFDQTHQRNQKLIETAPTDLRKAVTDLQEANDQLAAFYAEAGYEPGRVDGGALSQLLNDTGYADAVKAVTGYGRDTCKTGGSGG
jgi:hypothetical protein